jgi:DNA-binding protein HU-beta
MNKTELIKLLADETGTPKAEAEKVFDKTIDLIVDTVASGNEVRILNFGTFMPHEKPARDIRNPRSGEIMKLPRKTVAVFKPGKRFKNQVLNTQVKTA